MSTPHYGSKSLAAAVRAHRRRHLRHADAGNEATAPGVDAPVRCIGSSAVTGEPSTTGTTTSLHRLGGGEAGTGDAGGIGAAASTTLTTSAGGEEEQRDAGMLEAR